MSQNQPPPPSSNQPPASPPPPASPVNPPAPQQPDDGFHKQVLYDNLKYSTEEFDKTLLYVTSGMLAVSFAFIEKVINLKTATDKHLLVCGWILLCASILLYLIAHYIITIFINRAIAYYDPLPTRKQNRNDNITNLIAEGSNIVMLLLTITGSILIMCFIKINLNEKQKDTQKGNVKENSAKEIAIQSSSQKIQLEDSSQSKRASEKASHQDSRK